MKRLILLFGLLLNFIVMPNAEPLGFSVASASSDPVKLLVAGDDNPDTDHLALVSNPDLVAVIPQHWIANPNLLVGTYDAHTEWRRARAPPASC
ncbi:hypothetical protein [Oceanobacter mangrovi]|uniref:hypothetical protein n=1 Tax=Oceanobacter mangrovi TaxID=2862510 RepID=UPI001C8D7B14|nr:hypothetical protein [Oceanobacter mangrovi]